MKRKIPVGVAIILAVLLLTGVVYAATNSKTIEFFRKEWGASFHEEGARVAPLRHTISLGNVNVAFDDIVLSGDGQLYGSGTISAPEDVILMNSEYAYDAPDEALLAQPYIEKARQTGRNITVAEIIPDGYVIDGVLYCDWCGVAQTENEDGTLRFGFELGGSESDPTAITKHFADGGTHTAIAAADSYTLQLWVQTCEITPDFKPLDDTRVTVTWTVTVKPKAQ